MGLFTTVETGTAPLYAIRMEAGWVQPVFQYEDAAYCPAEDWRQISSDIGFYPVTCSASGMRHTGFPDPITRRRMRAAFGRRQRDR